ncbi:16S rRNA (guanine(966)-N(2))-methyltransferase RsmD [Cellulomonas wangsupingiae]|uniref:16S rRNA (Guanine(966)-N(2))-methyltransferase RsmD n=1 Tax=Cellulomonas wangsupingiae TaxID=2968085 RepID=A0ABY5K092_9CELL|nr:16S rRNA (guanine(966)-N(2))-methyltransferase RsmD [Cellulomonas wangsupingiae]MCC2335619.1 16S rRNA (guanine(966)-N(2))-methyltransferase RsmD [Cellulomonas wangsupingiae]MCM0640250.1 16S rRNA (guanine(966)-N(2))-methyltransferase RsmD [Cellulomonas wangsupingiae]UUI63856.1 16S rRNA (guanine(966)-N(2))-methyltransferase RsmD [Cellulomonas wangsupingiae]
MTRIVAGSAGGRRLSVPPSGTRPTSERVREALFSRLEHLDAVDGARVLDLYAGSGALGLEAASRGAVHVVLVDAARGAVEVCRRNARALGLSDRVDVVADRVDRYLARVVPAATDAFDLVLLDPPYDLADDELAGAIAGAARCTAAGGVVVVERSSRAAAPTWPAPLVAVDDRRYGETRVWFAERPVD